MEKKEFLNNLADMSAEINRMGIERATKKPKKMKSKIEKNIFNLMNAYAIASNLPEGNPNETKLKASEMATCVNSLMDLFNSQDKVEFRVEDTPEEKSTFDDGVDLDYVFSKENVEATTEMIFGKQDTPEEWVGKLWNLIDEYENSQDIASELKAITEVNQFIKQLLEDREGEVRNKTILQVRGWLFEYLDKLNNK